jgi:enamine deaminase RidA (YjgF/YER057c/UK114 family)
MQIAALGTGYESRSPIKFAGDLNSTTQVAIVNSPSVEEIHLCARPVTIRNGFEAQARSAYQALLAGLTAAGATLDDILVEKVFLGDMKSQQEQLHTVRKEFFDAAGETSILPPATTFVQQPPLHPGSKCEIQAYALLGSGPRPIGVRGLCGLPVGVSGRVVEQEGIKSIFISGITGGIPGDDLSFAEQASSAFALAESSLLNEGFTFRDVVRTWIYLTDLERDYDALNLVRRNFFRSRLVSPSPASTGIQGAAHPAGRAIGLDLRAVTGLPGGRVRTIHASKLNEAPTYGADFSRGMRVEFPDRTIVYVSGTASIDETGVVVHPGSIEGQVDRMLVNIESLLGRQGAGYKDLISLTTYLKRPDYRESFLEVAASRGLPCHVPHTVCLADVCRPEWLCETEAIAVLV